jgi:hypothetical protein
VPREPYTKKELATAGWNVSKLLSSAWMTVRIGLLNLASVTLAGGLPRTFAQACCHYSSPALEVRMFAFVNLAAASKPFNLIRS